jgi:two-component sensor histidine kinase
MSIATLQRQLALSTSSEVAIGPYFTDLCHSIAASMIGDPDVIRLTVHVDATVTSADVSVSLGLIVTELVINCLKHAFPENRAGGAIAVEFRSAAAGWTLTVSDNGVGISGRPDPVKAGLGTGIVSALAGKLQAQVHMSDNRPGTTVTVINAGGRDTPERSTRNKPLAEGYP